jgi:hypothetical protein
MSFAVSTAVLAWGCSGDSSSGSGGTADCASICQRLAALRCPNDGTEANCESQCNQTLSIPSCQAQASAVTSCLATAPIQCGANGKAETSLCQTEGSELTTCLLAALSGGDAGFSFGDASTAEACVGSSCPQQNLAGTPECDAFCTKIRTACGANASCNQSFWCAIRSNECEASTRARLACMASDMGGTVTCNQYGWSISGGQCSSTSTSCPDGG